jgi:hypothetical protein
MPHRDCTRSRSTTRALGSASVAPIEAANEAIMLPQASPNVVPAASVSRVAPGKDSAVTATQRPKNVSPAASGLAARQASSSPCRLLTYSRLKQMWLRHFA